MLQGRLHEFEPVGRALGAIMSDTQFKAAAYKSTTRQELLTAIDCFTDGATILPPEGWDSSIRIEPLGTGGGGAGGAEVSHFEGGVEIFLGTGKPLWGA